MDVGGVGIGLLQYDCNVFLCNCCHLQMTVNDLVHFMCVFLMLEASCRISSAGGWVNTSPNSQSGGELGEIVMTSSGWYLWY